MDCGKRQRNVQGVLGVPVDELVVISLFRKLCNGFGLSLSFEPGIKVDFDIVTDNGVKSTIGNPPRSPGGKPVAVPKHVKDDLDDPLEAHVHTQFRGGLGQLQWFQLQGNPLLSFATGIFRRSSATPNGHDLLSLKKLMREATSMLDLRWWIVSVPSSSVWHGRGRCLGEPP